MLYHHTGKPAFRRQDPGLVLPAMSTALSDISREVRNAAAKALCEVGTREFRSRAVLEQVVFDQQVDAQMDVCVLYMCISA